MVLPLGPNDGTAGGMDRGPPPEELLPRFRKIKVCVLFLLVSLLTKILAGFILSPNLGLNATVNSMNPILNSVIGIFLLKDDTLFKPMYNCLGSDVIQILSGFVLIFDPTQAKDHAADFTLAVGGFAWSCMMVVYSVSTALGLLAQILGGYQGYKCMNRMQEIQLEGMGDYALGGGAGAPFVGPGLGGAGGQGMAPMQHPEMGSGSRRQQQQTHNGIPMQPQGFQNFAGEGHRLS